MLYIVTCHLLCVENEVCGAWYSHRACCVASLPYSVCMEDGGGQCVKEHGVERHLPYVVCVENGMCGA